MLTSENLTQPEAQKINFDTNYSPGIAVRNLEEIAKDMLEDQALEKALNIFYQGKSPKAFLHANGILFLIDKQREDTRGIEMNEANQKLWSARLTLTIKDGKITLIMDNPYYHLFEHYFHWGHEGKSLEIHKWRGHEERQGQGIGTALFEAVSEGAFELGLQHISLDAIRNDASRDVGYIVWPKWGFNCDIPANFWEALNNFCKRVEKELPVEREAFTEEAAKLQPVIGQYDGYLNPVFSGNDEEKEALRKQLGQRIELEDGKTDPSLLLAFEYVSRYFYIQELERDKQFYKEHFSGLKWLLNNQGQLDYIQKILFHAPVEIQPHTSALWARFGCTLIGASFDLAEGSESWRIFKAYKASKSGK
ncbi:MAG TPA: GNAT family N-acetyltransferase [Ktedonobacteraceae bacterium]|nr:GNAT family N-acetyltransferase [Ktedonobacteraceae bacterium]